MINVDDKKTTLQQELETFTDVPDTNEDIQEQLLHDYINLKKQEADARLIKDVLIKAGLNEQELCETLNQNGLLSVNLY